MKKSLKPFVKWAGGKRQLIPEIEKRMPAEFSTYYEPFIGGGALLLAETPKKAVISDTNAQLINAYEQIKCNAEFVISELKFYDSVPCTEENYLALREAFNEKISDGILDVDGAALMIELNHRAFNGIYRVNKAGMFNVPWNHRENVTSFDEENIRNISKYLNENDVQIHIADFFDVCKEAGEGDFIFLDPPYIPDSVTSSSVNYTKYGFSLCDQQRVATLFKELDEKGASVITCNSNVPAIRDLYDGYKTEEVSFRKSVCRFGDRRSATELIISNK